MLFNFEIKSSNRMIECIKHYSFQMGTNIANSNFNSNFMEYLQQ